MFRPYIFMKNKTDIWKNVKFIVFFNHNLMTCEMWLQKIEQFIWKQNLWKKPQWCHWNKMTLPLREFDDAAETKNNSFKKTDDACWKQNDYIIKSMIYNHWLVSSKMMIKLLNGFKVAFVKHYIFTYLLLFFNLWLSFRFCDDY